MKKNLYLTFLLTILVIGACKYDKEDKLYPASTTSGSTCDTTSVTYTAQVKAVIDNRCAISGCHVSGAQLPDLSNYSGASGNSTRIQVRALDMKTMPPVTANPLTACEMSKLQVWINNGTPQ